MTDLVKEAGRFRSGGVGVFKGEQIVHMAPLADMVPQLYRQPPALDRNRKGTPAD